MFYGTMYCITCEGLDSNVCYSLQNEFSILKSNAIRKDMHTALMHKHTHTLTRTQQQHVQLFLHMHFTHGLPENEKYYATLLLQKKNCPINIYLIVLLHAILFITPIE